ncbi:hypothetical protein GHR28_04875 [Escherichia coli]|nr:hypothetical protein [Escherichia coli]ELX1905587.1 hypothetical protein [Escherichia coli]
MSMTTELAQRMKAAALNATGAYERLSVMPEGDLFDISLAEGTQLDADITALNSFHDEATPANVLALVEALEASQSENERMYKTLSERNGEPVEGLVKRVAELETYSKTTLEFREAALNENRHLKLELEIAEKRNAELEARTVKLPEKHCMLFRKNFTDDYQSQMAYRADEIRASLNASGVGIKDE